MHIAVDLDDVVLDFVGGVRAAVKTEFGVDLQAEDINQWNLGEILNPIIGRSWWSWMRDREWIWATFPAIDGAMGGLEVLRREGHYLELLTSKPQWAEHNVWKWLGKWRPPFQRVTIVGPDDEKVDFSDAVVLIDDKPGNLVEWEKDSSRLGLLFDRPHNQDTKQFVRVTSWLEVIDQIKTVAGGEA